ncbi:adhesion regulating molecule [Coemansia reversa NRRL 1564]|uniref:Adhesion regulating molecule n=1 Tax=Coemansia reversa (strain ATCC 12441 / NRRL 1564) TaxID=763665 RepID=A0A2G5B4B2_COERN|nr:adhesion regulating molecule [Coemansia reversa NRRL 1564]|eukprot:PIA13844.1 adhesion regulating molecule [Coemansia reversa NRRL 1564]
MATPLFSQQPQRGGSGLNNRGQGSVPGSLAEFKAGRLFRDGETNWVRPDPRRGYCYIKKEDDGLLRFCWKDRQAGAQVEEELIVFPGDVYLERVQQSSGRVYVLKFKSSSQRVFFWMQEPDADADDELISRVNSVLGEGGEDDMDIYGAAEEEEEEEEDDDDESRLLLHRHTSREAEALSRHNEQLALAQSSDLHVGSLPSAQVGGVPGTNLRRSSQQLPGGDVEPADSGSVAGMGASQLSHLRQLMSNIQVPEGYDSHAADDTRINLADVLTPSNLRAVLEDSRLRSSLFPTLPDNIPRTRQGIDNVIRSPQFQQSLDSLSYLLESGQLAPLVTQLGLDPEAGTSVAAFLEAIEKQLENERTDRDGDNDTLMD